MRGFGQHALKPTAIFISSLREGNYSPANYFMNTRRNLFTGNAYFATVFNVCQTLSCLLTPAFLHANLDSTVELRGQTIHQIRQLLGRQMVGFGNDLVEGQGHGGNMVKYQAFYNSRVPA